MNLFDDSVRIIMEAEEDPPGVDPPEANMDTASDSADSGDVSTDTSPPDIGDLSSPSMDGGDDTFQDDDGMDDSTGNGSGEENPDDLPLDEKGEIFAKVNILSSFRYLYKKVDDTLETIDKIDIVQIGNSVKMEDITEIKQKFSLLMDDIYTTIVYEFQQQYSNLKIKMVEYSSRYVLLTRQLVALIKRDQKLTS